MDTEARELAFQVDQPQLSRGGIGCAFLIKRKTAALHMPHGAGDAARRQGDVPMRAATLVFHHFQAGADKARKVAHERLGQVREAVGIRALK